MDGASGDEGQEWEGLPQVPRACKRRRLSRKRKETVSLFPGIDAPQKEEPSEEVVQLNNSQDSKELTRPQRRSANGVARLMDSLQETESITAAIAESQQSGSRRQHHSGSRQRQGRRPAQGLARKPQLGRVKKCSTKAVELIQLGELHAEPGWSNVGYIFPKDFISRTLFRSSIITEDNPEPIIAKSATGAWAGILARIKACIIARQKQGENLPPPSGTAIPGPEFFGLTDKVIVSKIEQLDPFHQCETYWQGKQDRLAYLLIYGNEPDRKFPARNKKNQAGSVSSRPVPRGDSDEAMLRRFMSSDSEDDDRLPNRWESLNRAERLLKRKGVDPANVSEVDENALLPGVIDPITLAPIQNPAMSPAGHVMGYLTWKAVLAEFGRCPFTKQSLHKEQLTVLTANNIQRLRNRLILP